MSLGIFFGLTGLDSIYYVDSIPEENYKIKTHDYKSFIGGPAANAAITFSLLGGQAILFTYLGNSRIATSIKEDLEHLYGITVYDYSRSNTLLPPMSTIVVNNKNASRTIYSGQPDKLLIQQSVEQKKLYEDTDFFFTDSNLPELTIPILKYIQQYNKPIILDLGSWKKNSLEAISLSNEIIASNNCRFTENNEDIFSIQENLNTSLIAITNGENNIIFSENKDINYISPPKTIAKDTLAAGDIFHGAYCFYRFNLNYNFKESLIHASYIAAESVKFIGPREGVIKYTEVNLYQKRRNIMTNEIARKIASLLNDRGFVLDEEIKNLPISYTKFPEWVKEHEKLIREEGYQGGQLQIWTTRFDGPGCAYGIIDIENTPNRSYIESFCK